MMSVPASTTFTPRQHVTVDAVDAKASQAAMLEYAYREFAPALLGYFRSHGMTAAEDLVGEVFVSVAQNLRGFRGGPDDLRRWVFTIARRRRADHIRRLILRRRIVLGEPPERAVPDHGDDVDVDLVAALGRLTRVQRDVVVLRFVADLSIHDVALILRRSAGAVKAVQGRALRRLAAHLASAERTPTSARP